MMWQKRAGSSAESPRLRLILLTVLVGLLTLSVTAFAQEQVTLDTDSPSSSEHSVRSWPGIGLSVGPSFGLLSGYWLRPGDRGVSGDVGIIIRIGHRFATRIDIHATAISDDPEDISRYHMEPTGGGTWDMWRWMLSITGYSNSHMYQPGSWTPYVSLGAGIARHGDSKFAAQFGGGSLVMFRDGIGLDLGANLTCVLNGWSKKYANRELACILDLKTALVLRVL